MATTLRDDAKQEIIRILRNQGYAAYARLVEHFHIYLTDDPNVIGYMIPGQAKIVLNARLSVNQVSVIIRHEILHEFLVHRERQLAHEKKTGKRGDHKLANIAGDYEISNKGYTDADKATARAIILGDQVLRGLVTEDDYPEWENATFEEMYDHLLEKREKDRQSIEHLLDKLDKVSQKDIEDLEQEMDDMSSDTSDNSSNKQTSNSDGGNDDNSDSGSDSADSKQDGVSQRKSSGASQKKSSDVSDKIDDLKDELDDIKSDLEDSSDSSVFDSDQEQKEKSDLAARVKEIKKLLQDIQYEQEVWSETNSAIRKEKEIKAAKDIERYNSSPLQQFKLSLNKFIADQVSETEEDSYTRIHPSYENTEFIRPGKIYTAEDYIPSINVYYDVSASFSSEAKTEGAKKAIATLNGYVKNGEIEISTWYFADVVSSTRSGAGGGTRGTPIQAHIKQTKPTNVIIITDGDISDCTELVTVPGAVWMLFYDSVSDNLVESIKGKRQTKYYEVSYKG